MIFEALVSAHSYLTCSNLINKDNNYVCQGFPRDFSGLLKDGGETYAYKMNSTSVPPIPTNQTKNGTDPYSPNYPMSQVSPGEQVTISWPSNAHDDGGTAPGPVYIYWSTKAGVDPTTLSEFQQNSIAQLNFSNCLTGKMLCDGQITIPKTAPGVYTFLFFWNNFTTAFDYNITTNPVNNVSLPVDISKPPGMDMDMSGGGTTTSPNKSIANQQYAFTTIAITAIFML